MSKLYKAYRNKDKISFGNPGGGMLHHSSHNTLEEISEIERDGQIPNSF
jgi:hypothetical protein